MIASGFTSWRAAISDCCRRRLGKLGKPRFRSIAGFFELSYCRTALERYDALVAVGF